MAHGDNALACGDRIRAKSGRRQGLQLGDQGDRHSAIYSSAAAMMHMTLPDTTATQPAGGACCRHDGDEQSKRLASMHDHTSLALPPFINIRCFSFVKQMYLYICFTKLKHLIFINGGSMFHVLPSFESRLAARLAHGGGARTPEKEPATCRPSTTLYTPGDFADRGIFTTPRLYGREAPSSWFAMPTHI
jgi:hypothetical protein